MPTPNYTLYLITDLPEVYPDGILPGVLAAIDGGVSIVQYRPTQGTRRQHYETASSLSHYLRKRGVPLIINDCLDLALAVDADGLHLGQEDLPVEVARRLLGPDKILGLSITGIDQLAQTPFPLIDYLGAGPVFATPTKFDSAPAIGIDTLARISRLSPLPVVAIGGINTTNAPSVFSTGVKGIAVVSALSQAPDPTRAAEALLRSKPAH